MNGAAVLSARQRCDTYAKLHINPDPDEETMIPSSKKYVSLNQEKFNFMLWMQDRISMRVTPYRTDPPNLCWGSMTIWCGSGSSDPYLWLMDTDPDPTLDPTPDPTPFSDDYRHIIFNLESLFCKHYFSLHNTFMRKGKDTVPEPDQYLWLMDPDPGGLKNMRILRIQIPKNCAQYWTWLHLDKCDVPMLLSGLPR